MSFVVIHHTLGDGSSGPYSGTHCAIPKSKVVKICGSKEEAEKYCKIKFNNVSCTVQKVED